MVPSSVDDLRDSLSFISGVNMTNCYKHCEHFFKRCTKSLIHYDVLISYWMMAGYLGPVDSVHEAHKKGHRFLWDLIKEGMLKHSDDDPEMIELVRSPDSKPIQCKHQGFCVMENIGFVDLLDVGEIQNVVLMDGMLKKQQGSDDGNYLSRQVFGSSRGLKYLSHFNPTPNSLKLLLENMKQPSMLLLRGNDLFPPSDFSLERFKTLTILEISVSNLLTTVPINPISKLIQLRYLYLSDPLIKSLPQDFFSQLQELRWLILRGCSRLTCLPSVRNLEKLEVLDLSGDGNVRDLDGVECNKQLVVLDLSATRIEFIEFLPNLIQLHSLILQKCTMLERLPVVEKLTNLEVIDISGCESLIDFPEGLSNLRQLKQLNLSGCICLEELSEGVFDEMPCLEKLDLSNTHLYRLPSFANLTSLRRLSLRDLDLDSLEVETWTSMSNLAELDLSGLKIDSMQELNLDFLESLLNLQILNLSKTSVTKLPDMSKHRSLKELLLADCGELKKVPDLSTLTNLEELDLSLPYDFTINSSGVEIETEAQTGLFISAPSSLRKLVLTNRSSVQKISPLTSFGSDFRGANEIDFIGSAVSRMEHFQGQERISKPIEIHIISHPGILVSGFDRFSNEFAQLSAFASAIQKNSKAAAGIAKTKHQAFERQFKTLHSDLKYIEVNIDKLQSSHNCNYSEKLLHLLIDATTHFSPDDFINDPANLEQLLRVVIQLKVLFATKQADDSKGSENSNRKKHPLFRKSVNQENFATNIDLELSSHECQPQQMDNLLLSYQSLTDMQKHCLLCFSAFPCNEDEDKNSRVFKSLVVKKRILIHWWTGAGFIKECNANPNLGTTMMSACTSAAVRNEDSNQEVEIIEDFGEGILKALTEKGFIEPVIDKMRETGRYRMHCPVHTFVIAQAKKEGFFNFDKRKGKLAPYFIHSRSRTNCALKPQGNFLSSMFSSKSTNSNKELESLRKIFTLFNVHESLIDIKPEYLSEMQSLSVLHLGSWQRENAKYIEVLDLTFMEDLKNLNQLRLLSLQGLSTIMKLPDSICKLTNLIILDLRECSSLEELPVDIGSLKNLTHLDITNCHLLSKLPRGIRLLSELQTLKGFVISYVGGVPQDRNACVLRDLSKLENLRNLSLVVNKKNFPDDRELEVFGKMKNLCKLKISWEKDFSRERIPYETLRPSRWQRLKCWEFHDQSREEMASSSKPLENIKKLVLWCFPYETFPEWLHPGDLTELKKLYIVGGGLKKLSKTSSHEWNVTTLRLKYLRYLKSDWLELLERFPKMTHLERHDCDELDLASFPENGIWVHDSKRVMLA